MLRIITVIALIVGISGLSSAQEFVEMKGSTMDGGMKSGMMCNEKIIKTCPMREKMKTFLMCKSLVETKEGGIVVMSGNVIRKYDKDLNILREVRMKIDM